MNGWLGVDFDGTLAEYDGWLGHTVLGEPIEKMVLRIKKVIQDRPDIEIRIFTARAYPFTVVIRNPIQFEQASRMGQEYLLASQSINAILEWTEKVFGKSLPVTCVKDYGMIELWDDRAIHVPANTGVLTTPTRLLK